MFEEKDPCLLGRSKLQNFIQKLEQVCSSKECMYLV